MTFENVCAGGANEHEARVCCQCVANVLLMCAGGANEHEASRRIKSEFLVQARVCS